MKKARLGVADTRSRLRGITDAIKSSGPVVYLMRRDIRANDNWSLLRCQEESRPVHVVHILEQNHPSHRLAYFYAKGLEECQVDLKALNIPLDVVDSVDALKEHLKDISAAGLVADLHTLREYNLDPIIKICDEAKIPLWEVDSHNIVPVWVASDKEEYAARTIRSKINDKLDEWLVEIPPTASNPEVIVRNEKTEFEADSFLTKLYGENKATSNIQFIPGFKAGNEALSKFLTRISDFEKHRNNPTHDALSGLSPWFRFGHLSKQRAALDVKKNTKTSASYLEELIVRGELAENYTFYNENYDNIKGGPDFGIKTLSDHAGDKREYVYTYEEFAGAKSHDPLWNAAQRQLVNDGKMHGFMRMYWAKKVLEWSESPEKALEIVIKLNDTFSMDGRDPRGYVGVMWSITGLHDQGWKERSIFGKVRYMNYEGCKKKFDIDVYMESHKALLE